MMATHSISAVDAKTLRRGCTLSALEYVRLRVGGARSSVGRAMPFKGMGRRFEPFRAHQFSISLSRCWRRRRVSNQESGIWETLSRYRPRPPNFRFQFSFASLAGMLGFEFAAVLLTRTYAPTTMVHSRR